MLARVTWIASGLAALSLLAGCGDSDIRTGPVRTETRDVGSFSAMEVSGATRLEVTVGSPVSVEIEGRDRFLQRLQTQVDGDTLYIKSTRKDIVTIGTSPRLIVRVRVPNLSTLKLEGGNDVKLSGFDGGATKIHVEGAANITGAGRLDELTVFMAGAGHVDLSELVAGAANVTVAGVGSVFVHSQTSLDATMNGVGAIFYAGNPQHVNTHINGLGTIGHRDRGKSKSKAPDEPEAIDPDKLLPEYEDDSQTRQITGVI
jgi:Putative auto-transporter adhesin, head GIN domain